MFRLWFNSLSAFFQAALLVPLLACFMLMFDSLFVFSSASCNGLVEGLNELSVCGNSHMVYPALLLIKKRVHLLFFFLVGGSTSKQS